MIQLVSAGIWNILTNSCTLPNYVIFSRYSFSHHQLHLYHNLPHQKIPNVVADNAEKERLSRKALKWNPKNATA